MGVDIALGFHCALILLSQPVDVLCVSKNLLFITIIDYTYFIGSHSRLLHCVAANLILYLQVLMAKFISRGNREY